MVIYNLYTILYLYPQKYIVLRGIFLLYYLYYTNKLIKAHKNEPCRLRLIKSNFEWMKQISVGYKALDDSQEVFMNMLQLDLLISAA